MKRGTPDHPKMWELSRALKINHTQTVGHMELLWHWTARFAPQGDIGKWTDEQIAKGAGWDGDPEVFMSGLVRTKFVQVSTFSRLVIHDWHDHADDSVRKYLKRNNLSFLSICPENVETCPEKVCLPVPLPEPEPTPEPLPKPEPHASVRMLTKKEFLDEQWRDLRKACRDRDVLRGSETDWEWAYSGWRILDPDQKHRAIADVTNRPEDSPELNSLPQNYVKDKKWTRPMPKIRRSFGNGKHEEIDYPQ